MMRWVVGSILRGGNIELILVPASAGVTQISWYVLSCLWDDAYKIKLAAYVAAAGFLSRSLSGHLPYA